MDTGEIYPILGPIGVCGGEAKEEKSNGGGGIAS
jgi:hypothetical protein